MTSFMLRLRPKDAYQNLIQNGLKRVKEFSWQKMAQQTLEVYNDALQS